MAGELRQNLFDLGLKHRTGHLENSAQLGRTRRELARLLTLVRESELGIGRAVKAEEPKGAKKAAAAKKGGESEGEAEKAAGKKRGAPKAKAEKAAAKGKAKKAKE